LALATIKGVKILNTLHTEDGMNTITHIKNAQMTV